MSVITHSLRPILRHLPRALKNSQIRMAVNLPHLPETEKLSTNVIRILGGQP